MSIKSDKWIRRMAEQHGMIEPFVEAQKREVDRAAAPGDGPGIAPEHLPRLTERFYRVDTHRSRAKGGTGLGLAIVKHIVHRHRGRLRIESTRGQGSRFTVLLPESLGRL